MDHDPYEREPGPVNPLPPVVVVLFLVIFGIEGAFLAGEGGYVGGPDAVGWRLAAIRDYGFSPQVFAWMMDSGQWPAEHLLRCVTYPFLHGTFTQMLFSGVILLAIGKLVGEVMGGASVAALFFGSAIAGALAYGLLQVDDNWLYGAFPGVFGLIGGYTFLMWSRLRSTGGNPSRAFQLIAFLMGIQLVFGVLFGGDRTWVADLAGFATGFGLCFVLVPAARAALLARLRQRD